MRGGGLCSHPVQGVERARKNAGGGGSRAWEPEPPGKVGEGGHHARPRSTHPNSTIWRDITYRHRAGIHDSAGDC